MEISRHPNERSFAKKELQPVSRGNRPAETLGNAWQHKRVKTSATRHCESRNTHDMSPQNRLFEQ